MSQIVQFGAPSGLVGVTATLFVPGVDAVVATMSASEGTHAKGQFVSTFSGVTPGTYLLIALDAGNYPVADWLVDISASGTFLGYDGPTVGARPITVVVPPAVAALSQSPSMLVMMTWNVFRTTLTMGTIAGRSGLWFSVKTNATDPDSAALILISESGGLLVANGAAASNAGLGSLTVTDPNSGLVNVYVHESIMGLIAPTNGPTGQYYWDAKYRLGTDATAPCSGRAVVNAGVTQAF